MGPDAVFLLLFPLDDTEGRMSANDGEPAPVIEAPTGSGETGDDVERRRAYWRTPEMRTLMRRALDDAAELRQARLDADERAGRPESYEAQEITALKGLAAMRLKREARQPAYRLPEIDEALRLFDEGEAAMLERLATPSDDDDGTA